MVGDESNGGKKRVVWMQREKNINLETEMKEERKKKER